MSRSLLVVSAGLSSPSSTRLLADRLADAVVAQVSHRGEAVDVDVIELSELITPLGRAMATGNMPDPELDDVRRRLSAADGLIAVTPVFRASYSGLFKMFFDVMDEDALVGMPVLIAATAGTPRHSLVLDHALRPLFAYSRATVLPTGVFAATEDFGTSDTTGMEQRIAQAAREMAAALVSEQNGVQGFLAPELSGGRQRSDGVGLAPAVTDFSELLKGHDGLS